MSWLRGRNVALASHAAAVDADGNHSIDILLSSGVRVTALFGPEHGFAGTADAGASVKTSRHRKHKTPIYSLYGKNRQPASAMLKDIDTIVIDFQNLPARCYTYLATTINIMRAAEKHGLEVVVADRPVPLPNTVDGPPLSKGFESFVAPAPLPLAYGMTPGETALWISRRMNIRPELKVARMTGYHREEYPRNNWPLWIKPSPAITSWDAALCYLSTVSSEAFPVLNISRGGQLSFQAFNAPFLDADHVAALLNSSNLPGVIFHPVKEHKTILIEVCSPRVFKPVRTGAAILWAITETRSSDKLWKSRDVRPEFFDQLFGGTSTRNALKRGASVKRISSGWRRSIESFRRQRAEVLLYRKTRLT